jgi:malonate transporter
MIGPQQAGLTYSIEQRLDRGVGPRPPSPRVHSHSGQISADLALGSMPMVRGGGASGAGRRTAWHGLTGLARNLVILSICCGVLLAAAARSIPDPIERFLAFLGGAAEPTALFALGGTLARLAVDRDLLGIAASVMLVMLVAYPALVWLVLGVWLQLDGVWVTASVLLAAIPTATNALLLAHRHGAGADAVSAAVLLFTVVAAVTFPLTASLLDGPLTPPPQGLKPRPPRPCPGHEGVPFRPPPAARGR